MDIVAMILLVSIIILLYIYVISSMFFDKRKIKKDKLQNEKLELENEKLKLEIKDLKIRRVIINDCFCNNYFNTINVYVINIFNSKYSI
ncbi:hypothetical protein SVTS2p10 [Spiroplasma phage SVTS2]|uniref:ORF 17 n=1 Tax=Spiroplasma phage SVTS2 TaxID=93224 RepID=Q9QTH3_9VIRU|nr:hypothetical protein SVTS2p10 [Spiroplasma phage SVTS2]AAF18314.1 ORF 17 [Spiroplasma phage SVTS2]